MRERAGPASKGEDGVRKHTAAREVREFGGNYAHGIRDRTVSPRDERRDFSGMW